MQYVLKLLLGVFLLASGPATAQDLSLGGVELGMSFLQAEEVLAKRAGKINNLDDSYAYVTDCLVRGKRITIAATKSDFASEKNAKVQEVEVNLSAVDVSRRRVARLYNRYKKRWTQKLGSIESTKRGQMSYWTWDTDSLEAQIVFTTLNGRAESVDLSLNRP